MKRLIFILSLISILSHNAFGQISEGGEPISFSLGIDTEKEKIPVTVMPPVDVKALLEEDEKLEKEDAQRPFRFGYGESIDVTSLTPVITIAMP